MGDRSEWAFFLKGRHTNDQHVQGKILNITNHHRMAITKQTKDNKNWRDRGVKGIFVHCWWGCSHCGKQYGGS